MLHLNLKKEDQQQQQHFKCSKIRRIYHLKTENINLEWPIWYSLHWLTRLRWHRIDPTATVWIPRTAAWNPHRSAKWICRNRCQLDRWSNYRHHIHDRSVTIQLEHYWALKTIKSIITRANLILLVKGVESCQNCVFLCFKGQSLSNFGYLSWLRGRNCDFCVWKVKVCQILAT